jgi:hypothetical protein
MTNAVKFLVIDGGAGDGSAHLLPANDHARKMAGQARVGQVAGPFDMPADDGKGASLRDALMTGLLVIYPALATVAAIVAGLFLASANGT